MSNQPSRLKDTLSAVGSKKSVKAIDLVRQNPQMAAVISKLTKPIERGQYDEKGQRRQAQPDTNVFKNMSNKMIDNIHDSETVMQLLPDMELSAQILVSSILSPKDMTTTELIYNAPEGILPSDTAAAVINSVKRHFEQVYKIKPLLPKILRDMLFMRGSYPIAVIPENALDDVINGSPRLSTESIKPHLMPDGSFIPRGILGPSKAAYEALNKSKPALNRSGIAMETMQHTSSRFTNNEIVNDAFVKFGFKGSLEELNTVVSVTDNTDILKVPRINERIRQQAILDRSGIPSFESYKGLSDVQLTSLLYSQKDTAYKPMASLKTQEQLKRTTVGNPLILQLPSEAVIPVHIPGVPETHIGYFVLLDGNGYPINAALQEDYLHQMGSKMTGGTDSFPSAMLNKVDGATNGNETSYRDRMQIDYSVRAYADMVEQDLLERLKNGVYGNGVALGRNDEVYHIMLARTLSKQNTQLLFVPVELMTYFAIRFNRNGIGRSLIDDMRVLLSLRVMTMFSNVMASVKNSIGRTDVKLKLDEMDPDPQKTIEQTINELMKARQQYFPIGRNAPMEIVDWLQRAGMEFTFEGHPGLPDVQMEIGEKNTTYTKPDTDLEDSLRKRSIMGFGLSPEMVDNGFQAEFATTVVANNLLLSKRVLQVQEQFMPLISDHVRKVINNSQALLSEINGIITDNISKIKIDKKTLEEIYADLPKEKIVAKIAYDFINQIEVKLPAPNSVTLENQSLAMETYTKILEPMLDSWISDRFITTDTSGDIANQVNTMKEMFKSFFLRRWAADNGVLPELSILTATDEHGELVENVYKEQSDFIGQITKHMTQFMVHVKTMKDATNTVLGADAGMEGGGTPSESSSSETEGEDTGGDEFSMEMPGDELGGNETPPEGSEAPAEEQPAEEETPPEEEKPETPPAE